MNEVIYLDNAATTYPKPEVVYNTMDKFLRESCVNAGRGSYKMAGEANNLIKETRNLLLDLINADANKDVIFTPSATIAINQVLRGLQWESIKNVYVSPFEHNAIMRTLHSLQKYYDFNINVIKFNNITFKLDEEDLKINFAKHNPDLLILSHVSNVTGYILPIERCQELASDYNCINVVDCAQSMGLVSIDVQKEFSRSDFLIFAGHKSLYGPLGIAGFIYLNKKIELQEVITGGTGSDSTNLEMPKEDEKRYEPGSYNMHAISGLNAALKWINSVGVNTIYQHEKSLTNNLIEKLEELSEIELYLPQDLEKHIGAVSFNIEGYDASEVGSILDSDFNICVRTGHHCAPLVGEFLDGMAVKGTVRVSLGYFNEEKHLEEFIEAVDDIL